ncbi:MAG: sugar phosphate isomerase/epimerase family protein [Candidatus Geothermarchaeales archaeon]
MRLGFSTLAFYKKSFKECVDAINVHEDIRHWEILDDSRLRIDEERARILKELSASNDVEYSVHAPFSDINIATVDSQLKRTFLKILRLSLETAHKIGAKMWILHPGRLSPYTCFFPDEAWEANLAFIGGLVDHAEELGVRIAVENLEPQYSLLARTRDIEKFFNEFETDKLGFCLDVGHANLAGEDPIDRYVSDFGDVLTHIHVHDNDGKLDSHDVVGKGSIDWPPIFSRLREIKYRGLVVIEAFSLEDALSSYANVMSYL